MKRLREFSAGKIVLCTALLAALVVYLLKPTPASVNLADLAIKPPEELALLKEQMYLAVDITNLSSLSLRLMVAAQWGESAEYERAKNHMFSLLEIAQPLHRGDIPHIAERIDAYQAWMLGRMLISAWYMKEKEVAQYLSKVLSAYTARSDVNAAPTAPSVWAAGYVLEYDAHVDLNQYYKHIDLSLANANTVIATAQQEQAFSTITWIHVVNLYAAAVAHDSDHYVQIKTDLGYGDQLGDNLEEVAITHKNILNALMNIPMEDFRAWAYFWTMRAAAVHYDESLLFLLNNHGASVLDSVYQELLQVEDALRTTPSDKNLQARQESLRNDYVLGATNALYAKHAQQL